MGRNPHPGLRADFISGRCINIYMNADQLLIRRLSNTARIPTRATGGSAGFDLYADLAETVVIEPGDTAWIHTGVAAAVPMGAAGLVVGRSGLGTRHGVVPANAVGVVDSDFRGEILVVLRNHSGTPYAVRNGDRVAQLVLVPVLTPQIVETDCLDETPRGPGGWGSTGR